MNQSNSVLRQNDEKVKKLFETITAGQDKTLVVPIMYACRERTEGFILAAILTSPIWDSSKIKLPAVGIDRTEAHFFQDGKVKLGYVINLYSLYQQDMNDMLEQVYSICLDSGIRIAECKQKKDLKAGDIRAVRWKMKILVDME